MRSKWIGWYRADFKRCADADGLEWWVTQYNNNNGCLASNNYDGFGTKDACWRWHFQEAGRDSYEEAKSTGHISSTDEVILCGPNAAYPWIHNVTNGTQCKYKP
ncbi:hypothetical protein [Pyxidicoccus trucidator]|uniref:hypothetical protein n=1 Tax=Pyxidicoccus trucidator TaxID=2709662 RepID=UPI0013D908AE|nr:hypothetical protein [Pyxidicoccus trucidator]